MKMRSPLNSTLATPSIGMVGFPSALSEVNQLIAFAANGTKSFQRLALALLTAVPVLTAWTTNAKAAGDDNFELAMVIKSTTNPYYNATLSGARIAAKEIGGSANNYGPTESSGQAQVELINNLADRHIPAIAVAPATRMRWCPP